MIERFTQNKIRWINLKTPTPAEIKKAMTELDIPFILMNDLMTPVPKNSAVVVDSVIKITLDFPVVKRIDTNHAHEVKYIISKRSLLTVQYEEMEAIDRFKRQFEVSATLRKSQKGLTGAHLFISLINNFYDSASAKLDYIETKLSDIETDIFNNNEKQMVIEISEVSKRLIRFRHVMGSHAEIFDDATLFLNTVYKNIFAKDLQDIQGHSLLLTHRTNTLFDTLTALRETNIAMLNTRQNEIIKNLTLMAFITFPLSLLSSMFGMNTETTPIIGTYGDFWVIVGIMLLGVVGFFIFFKRKGWL
ncbi:MAG: magnesium transporter CorA family protein [Candidatus Pacebacteria bacterium]|nr:magnesium transporter CorA family protein [Candidatus Paceibacterota bacterium]MCF7857122.1 magnesium transporter CorA family protein [Candidatus Paceibacterota bacterium]